jgi:predicted alpha/beta-hydrolase family hydrolase
LALGLSQVDIAAKIGTQKQSVALVAAGQTRTGRVVDGVASVLGCSTEWLLDGVGDPPAWWVSQEPEQAMRWKRAADHAQAYAISKDTTDAMKTLMDQAGAALSGPMIAMARQIAESQLALEHLRMQLAQERRLREAAENALADARADNSGKERTA